MLQTIIETVIKDLDGVLDSKQEDLLREVLQKRLTCFIETDSEQEQKNNEYLTLFIAAKRVEGCSEKTLKYYLSTIFPYQWV